MLKRQDTHIVAVHQPNFFPWFGYFVKIALSDTFILLDDVQIPWRGYTRRTKIRRPGNDPLLEWCPVIIPSGYTYAGIKRYRWMIGDNGKVNCPGGWRVDIGPERVLRNCFLVCRLG